MEQIQMSRLSYCDGKGETCLRLLRSPEELTRGQCRYCLRGLEPSTDAFFQTYRETMSYGMPHLRLPQEGREISRPPAPKSITWDNLSLKGKKVWGKQIVASTTLATGTIHMNYGSIAAQSARAAKIYGLDVETLLPEMIAEVQMHELIHAWGQIGHTTQRREGYVGCTNQVFDKIEALMGHDLWLKYNGKDTPSLNRIACDLDTELPNEPTPLPSPKPVVPDLPEEPTFTPEEIAALDPVSRAYLEGRI